MQQSEQQTSVLNTVARREPDAMTRRAFLRRAGIGGLGLVAAGGLLLGGGNVAYGQSHSGQIFPGVAIAGIALGGLTPEAAREQLAARFAAYSAESLAVGVAGEAARWQTTPGALGATADLDAALAAALAVGRDSGPLGNASDRLGARFGGAAVPLPADLDDARLIAALQGWAPGVTAQPTDAAFAPDGGGLKVVPDRAGRGLDPDGGRSEFLARFAALSTEQVELPTVPITASITAADLNAIRDEASALVATPLTLRVGDRTWSIDPDLLRSALVYSRAADGTLEPSLRAEPLRQTLNEIVTATAAPPTDARIAQDESGRYRITAAAPGAILDEGGAVAALTAALRDPQRVASVALAPKVPATTEADLQTAFGKLDAILNTPLVVTFEEFSRTYDRSAIAPMLTITPKPGTPERVAFTLDDAKLTALVADLAKSVNQEPRDAQFKLVNGAVQDVANGRDGRVLQADPTKNALSAAILGATGRATPAVTVTKPAVPAADKAQIIIRDRLGRGQTSYAGTANRIHNVELAAERLNGALIPPDGVFSFNDTIGAQTIENGYKEGYAIALVGGPDGGKGNLKTVTSIGGGICQVSTTLFQGVYAAGLPLEERNWHSFWLLSYDPERSPTAKKGLDATVDDVGGLDFRFRNTTGGWLAIESIAKGGALNIAVLGVDPGWQVQNDEPVITNIRPADPKPKLEKTHDLAPGETLVVEVAVDGFDAANHTRVLDRTGKVLRDKTFTSSYAPSSNVTQVGVPKNEPLT